MDFDLPPAGSPAAIGLSAIQTIGGKGMSKPFVYSRGDRPTVIPPQIPETLMHARITRATLPLATALSLLALPAAAQEPSNWAERCRSWNRDENRETVCEERETRLGARESLTVDGRQNGGVSVRAWDGRDVLVRAQIQTTAPSREEAGRIARQVTVSTSGGTIRASGPETEGRRSWAVSYEIFVPRRMDLSIETHNGPISVAGVSGEMELEALNGPMNLRDVGGDVRARTTNGPLNVQLAGSRWSGDGLDAQTVNGPVNLIVPDGYSAELETGTVHGPMRIDIPVTVRGQVSKHIRTRLGSGGAPIRVMTTNGPVTVRSR
jgi:hypothetical protein